MKGPRDLRKARPTPTGKDKHGQNPVVLTRNVMLAEKFSFEKRVNVNYRFHRLAERGLVTREPAADDRRGAFVKLTVAAPRGRPGGSWIGSLIASLHIADGVDAAVAPRDV